MLMLKSKRKVRLVVIAALVLCVLALVLPASVLAQCPLCRAGLEGDRTARTMNLAIVVLLIPPVSIFCTIFAIAYRKRKSDDDDDDDDDNQALEP
jgi:heme/copper-type cytochrome/quinol oxidase subunit 2